MQDSSPVPPVTDSLPQSPAPLGLPSNPVSASPFPPSPPVVPTWVPPDPGQPDPSAEPVRSDTESDMGTTPASSGSVPPAHQVPWWLRHRRPPDDRIQCPPDDQVPLHAPPEEITSPIRWKDARVTLAELRKLVARGARILQAPRGIATPGI